ncbi:MAG TPA: nuclear transport factor 2 family protein [Acidimicrobiia bacterium]|jgi:ketosteroid isomerase-like protein|nr:nuclear transport factor 2 family protein [Acidimicrobiia bacterium]
MTSNADRVRAMFALINTMDIDALIEYFADDAVMELPFAPGQMPKEYRGKASAYDFQSSVKGTFSEFSMMLDSVYETTDPQVVIAEHHAHAVVAGNGRPYDNRYITIFTFDDDGKITNWREYYDAGVVVRAFRA